jgi:hypothetical protein
MKLNHFIVLHYGNFCSNVPISEMVWATARIKGGSRLWRKAPDWKVITRKCSSFNTLDSDLGNEKSGTRFFVPQNKQNASMSTFHQKDDLRTLLQVIRNYIIYSDLFRSCSLFNIDSLVLTFKRNFPSVVNDFTLWYVR